MWARRILLVVTIVLVALPTCGGTVSAQGSTSCTMRADIAWGSSEQTMEWGGMTRSYVLYIPPGYDPSQPTPLVLSLHGFAGNPREQEHDSGWDAIADRENFLVVYPAGTGTPLRWNAGQREVQSSRLQGGSLFGRILGEGFFETVQVDDVGFIRDLIAELSGQLCIDSARVYVNGMSNGGGMTNRLACEAADVFAAAGMVAGAYTDFGGCHPARPIPVIAFHGVKDPIVPYEGGGAVIFPPIETWVADWAARDQCAASEAIPDTVGTVTGTRYAGCAGDAEVDFYSIADGGHTWPGSEMGLQFLLGKTSHDIDASETMWAFFSAHPMPAS